MMLELVKSEVTKVLMTVHFRTPEDLAAVEEPEAPQRPIPACGFAPGVDEAAPAEAEADGDVAVMERPQPFVRGGQKVGRNDPCPCRSGKSYCIAMDGSPSGEPSITEHRGIERPVSPALISGGGTILRYSIVLDVIG